MQNPTQSSLKPLSPCFQAAFPCKGRLKFRFQTASNATTRNAKADSLYTPKGNRISEFDGTRYIYDDLGNTKLRELPDGETQLYTYDTENQLSTATVYKKNGSIEKWRYAYDPFGRRLSKERIDKGSLKSTNPKCTVFVWDGTRMVQEYNYKGVYTYLYTDQDSYEPLAHVFHNGKDGKLYLSYYHTDQIGLPREQTDQFGNLLWVGEYDAWGSLKTENRVYPNAHQPFRLQNQYCDEETGLHYNLFRYYDPRCGRFVNQDPIGLLGGEHLYAFAPNALAWYDQLGLWAIGAKFKYHRDQKGKLLGAIALIREADIGTGTGTTKAARKQAQSFGLCDDAGHLIGSNLGGRGRKNETFAQNSTKNRGEFNKFEGWVADEVRRTAKTGGQVFVRVKLIYDDLKMPNRPSEIIYQVRSGGKTIIKTFSNPSKCC